MIAAVVTKTGDAGNGREQAAAVYQATSRGSPPVLAMVVLRQALQPELQVPTHCRC